MSAERSASLQMDMFTGELVDNRTQTQKQRDREAEKPQQTEMFSAREVLQFGVNPHPLMPIAAATRLELQVQDPRTDEEKERDLQRAAEALTYKLLPHGSEDSIESPEVIEIYEQKSFYLSMIALRLWYNMF